MVMVVVVVVGSEDRRLILTDSMWIDDGSVAFGYTYKSGVDNSKNSKEWMRNANRSGHVHQKPLPRRALSIYT